MAQLTGMSFWQFAYNEPDFGPQVWSTVGFCGILAFMLRNLGRGVTSFENAGDGLQAGSMGLEGYEG